MSKTPRISDAEWEVMNVIWDKSPVTANEVVDALADRTNWSPKTVKTMLNRLVKKRVLGFQQQGKAYLYSPKAKREACVRTESRSFMDRVFGGNAAPMLVHLVRNADLSQDDINELKKIIAAKGK